MNYGRYQIIKKVGEGMMGVVYQAHDPRIDRIIALKVLREDLAGRDDSRLKFVSEAQATSQLEHPGWKTDEGRTVPDPVHRRSHATAYSIQDAYGFLAQPFGPSGEDR